MFQRINIDYHVTVGILLVLLILLIWKIRSFMKLYSQFPSYSLLIPHLIMDIFLGKVPHNLPFTGFCFQRLVTTAKRFRNEGMVLTLIGRPTLLIFGEHAVKIFSNEQEALDKSSYYEILKESFGNGLITSNRESWRKDRKMLNPVFHVGILKNKVHIFNEHAQILIKKLEQSVDKTSIDVLKYIEPCTFGILFEHILDLKMDKKEDKEVMETILKYVKDTGEFLTYRFFQPLLHFKFMLKCVPSGRKYLRRTNDIMVINRKVIADIKESIVNEGEAKSEKNEELSRKSFIHILLKHHLNDPSFTMEDLQSQVNTFVAAGFDTISFGLVWTIFMLGHHPDVQENAHNEVKSIASEGFIGYEDLIKLKYLESVIKETLRLYPPVPIYGRSTSSDIQCGKYLVPKGMDILIFPYMLHRNPELYPDPEKFDPERFLESTSNKRNSNHIPFSEGIRNCIGKRFAMMEMKVILAYMLRNFKITSLDRREDVDFRWCIALSPSRPLLFRFTPRT